MIVRAEGETEVALGCREPPDLPAAQRIPTARSRNCLIEIYVADEIFLCGNGMQVAAVSRVDHRPIGSGGPGPITGRLRALHARVVHGTEPRYIHWITRLPTPSSV